MDAGTDYTGMKEIRYSRVNLLRVAQSFPATPRIMARLGPLLRDPNTALGEITIHLKRDSTLAARLLRIANSAAFAQSEPVASIEEAAALIGLQHIHRLVGAVAVDPFAQRNHPLYGFTGPQLRDNALLVGLLMEELAAPAREDPAAAYTAGLFRGLGKLVLAMLADEHALIAAFRPADLLPLVVWERDSFGLTSNQATADILKEWHFPTEVTQAIEQHYDPAAHYHPMSGLLNLAAGLAEQQGRGLAGESAYWLAVTESSRPAGLTPRQIERATECAVAAFDRISQALA